MSACRPEEKTCGADDGRGSQAVAAPECEKPDDPETQAGETHLVLKRTVRPPNEPCRHFREEDVHHEIVEQAKPDGHEAVIREQSLRDSCAGKGFRTSDKREARAGKAEDQKTQGEIAQDESDQFSEHDDRIEDTESTEISTTNNTSAWSKFLLWFLSLCSPCPCRFPLRTRFRLSRHSGSCSPERRPGGQSCKSC